MMDTMVEQGGFFPPHMRIVMRPHPEGVRFLYPVGISEMIEVGIINPEFFGRIEKKRCPTVDFLEKINATFSEQMEHRHNHITT